MDINWAGAIASAIGVSMYQVILLLLERRRAKRAESDSAATEQSSEHFRLSGADVGSSDGADIRESIVDGSRVLDGAQYRRES